MELWVTMGIQQNLFPQSISLNSDFSSATWSMTALSAGTDDIVAQSGVTIAAPDASFTPAAGTYANQTVTYNLISSTTSDAYLPNRHTSIFCFWINHQHANSKSVVLFLRINLDNLQFEQLQRCYNSLVRVNRLGNRSSYNCSSRVSPVQRPIASTLPQRFQECQVQSKRLLIWLLISAQPATVRYAQPLILLYARAVIQDIA